MRGDYSSRLSFCCALCRKRSTSLTVRFLGRRAGVPGDCGGAGVGLAHGIDSNGRSSGCRVGRLTSDTAALAGLVGEQGATLVTTNRIYKNWASIFDKNAVLTSALLDRLLHHAETVLIEGKSFRSKDQVEV